MITTSPRARSTDPWPAPPVCAVWVVVCLQLAAACGESSRSPMPKARVAREPVVHDPASERAPSWATEVGKSLARGWQLGAATRVVPATVTDRAFDTDEPVAVRRLVYRVSIAVPDGLRAPHPPLLPSPAELHLDVAIDRLRGRFHGLAWPIDEGTQVRMRADVPGVYLFDGAGGRPLAPGHLASWFFGDEAHPIAREQVDIRRDSGPTLEGPAELVCAFIAEWTAHSREALAQHCSGGAIPPSFRFGMWVADLTALVPMTMQRSQLRADAANPPRSLSTARIRTLLNARDIARLSPLSARSVPNLPIVDAGPAGSGVLRVTNRARARMLVVVQGVPLAWLQPAAATEFGGFTPGYYRVAALRPYTFQPGATPAPMLIPGDLELGSPAAESQLESPRPSNSPEAAR